MRKALIAAAVTAAAAVLAPAAASAATTTTTPRPVYTAVTHLAQRPDSGGNGNWANDTFTRTAHVQLLGRAVPANCGTATGRCFVYGAWLDDAGKFRTIPGAYAPNQGAYPGTTIGAARGGTFTGYGKFATFYATARPIPALVPAKVSGSNYSSSTWPELFFPVGTTFAGVNEQAFGYFYKTWAPVQKWADTDYNNSGQDASAGNITK
jgi:hypothetical protein